MNYANFYKVVRRQLLDSITSLWVSGHPKEQEYLKELLDKKEPLLAEPVFQTIFPWESSKESFAEHASKLGILDEDFIDGLSSVTDEESIEYVFPAERHPYKHQTESWRNLLLKKKNIVVTSGTGSGKTECFMIPVLQDLLRCKRHGDADCVQAIFLYPLNALMNNQQKRIHAWCKSLSPQITYAIYNGDTEKGTIRPALEKEYFPRIYSRPQIRETPPQILFTNPTMLNYMLVRSEDRAILEKSQGKLRWILLDEAHTYTGSAATELALQIRQLIDAFGVTIDDVRFAVTSATIGDTKESSTLKQIKEVVSGLIGKSQDDIVVIDGNRIIPEMNECVLENQLNLINDRFGSKVKKKDIIKLRKTLNGSASMSASRIAEVFNKKLDIERQLELIDCLSTKIPHLLGSDAEGALLPTRAHFFIRAINGVYACINTDCPTAEGGSLDLGSLTTYQQTYCKQCKSPLLEVATCSDCGGLVLVGENSTTHGYRMHENVIQLDHQLFDIEEEDEDEEISSSDCKYTPFVIGIEDKVCPRSSVRQQYVSFDIEHSKLTFTNSATKGNSFKECQDEDRNTLLCPHCGTSMSNKKLQYFRASANFMGRILASVILENAEPMDGPQDCEVLREGRKYIAFTDSRQGTAKSAMSVNQDVERNWVRSAIFHLLAAKRREGFQLAGELSPDDQRTYDMLINMHNMPARLAEVLTELKKKISGIYEPDAIAVAWKDIEHLMEADTDLRHLFHHLSDARTNEVTKKDTKKTYPKPAGYLKALYVDQMGWIPKRGNTLETLGLVHLIYPPIEKAKVPEDLGRLGFTDKDWKDYLKICVDYFVRSNRHIMISSDFSHYLPQLQFATPVYEYECEKKGVLKWPVLEETTKNHIKEKQSRIVLLLCAALGLTNSKNITAEQKDLVNTTLVRAWNFIKQNVLTVTDFENGGYQLDLFDHTKVNLQLTTQGWVCPVENVIVDTLFKGYSPRIKGYIDPNNYNRYKVKTDSLHYPFYPFGNKKALDQNGELQPVSDDEIHQWLEVNWSKQREMGQFSYLHTQILEKRPIYIAGEHSAQQQRSVLEKYESDFNQGRLNILSCSTTMEMGVDLKGISEVVMNTVPPKPANYLQRAGRAGRRGESKAMAITFCPPTPIGLTTWNDPQWAMTHTTQMPQIKMESRQIIQRHVNSFLFASFVAIQGGMRITATIEEFFGGGSFDKFSTFLESICAGISNIDCMVEKYKRLVVKTSMESISLEEAASRCELNICYVCQLYKDRLSALEISLEKAMETGGRAFAAVKNKKEHFEKTSLLPFLAENNFLPTAGIPTGLVEFVPDITTADNKYNNRKLPTQHLSQAISNYAPGNQIVLNEWCYTPSGISLKTRFDQTKKNVIQSCSRCRYSLIVYGQPLVDCPVCHAHNSMAGLKDMAIGHNLFTEIIEPAAFSVAWGDTPTRSLRPANFNFIQPLLLKMEPWSEKVKGAKFIMRSSTPQSEILFYNKGNSGYGFALCPYCGRMESESHPEGLGEDRHPLSPHKHLETGGSCNGNENGGTHIRRHVLLVGRYQTDFVEIKFYDKENDEIVDEETLYSLGVIISRKLTEVLGVNEGEIDFGYNSYYHSIFIYDTALGGSGYSLLLRDYKNEVLEEAYATLASCKCSKACTHCLIDRRTQWYINYLNREKAKEWLEQEKLTRSAPDEVRHVFDNASVVTSDLLTELYQLTRNDNLQSLHLFISADISKWEPDTFRYEHLLQTLRVRGVETSFVLSQQIDLTNVDTSDLTMILSVLFRNKFEVASLSLQKMKPLLLAKFLDGRQVLYFGDGISQAYSTSWGDGVVYSATPANEYKFDQFDKNAVLMAFHNDKNVVFEFFIKDRVSGTDSLLNCLMQNEADKWSKIMTSFDGKSVEMEYADRYLCTPLGCIILGNLIKQLNQQFNMRVKSLTFHLNDKMNTNERLQQEWMDANFVSISSRDVFIKESIHLITGIEPVIRSGRASHHRCLSIKTEGFSCSIRPDAGVAWGWRLENAFRGMTKDDLEADYNQSIRLFNCVANSTGILYTVAFKQDE